MSRVRKKSATKTWVGWFRPLTRGWREGSLVAAPIEIARDGRRHGSLVITVPGSCGNAVQRNRFRRIAKAYFGKNAQPTKAIWIRMLNRHRLGHKIRLEDWEKDFQKLASKV